jgi:hypothetical protein
VNINLKEGNGGREEIYKDGTALVRNTRASYFQVSLLKNETLYFNNILPAVFYGCETKYLIPQDRALWRTFRTVKSGKVTQ